jgi:hypothetical protein
VVDIQEEIERAVEQTEEAHEAKSAKFRNKVAIYVGFVGLLLAVVHMAGGAATKHAMLSGLESSDTWSYYQAKVIRSSILDSASTELGQFAAVTPDAGVKARIADQTKAWAKDIQRMKDDPKGGHGMKQLQASAEAIHARQLHAMAQDENYDLAETLLQVAIVFASIAMVATSPMLFSASIVMTVLGALAGLNGWLLLAELL